MKSSVVRRNVQSGAVGRKAGDAPNLGRVSKMHGYGLPHKKRGKRHRATHEEEQKKSYQLGWSIAIGVMVMVVLGVAFAFWVAPFFDRNKDVLVKDWAAADAQVRVASEFKSPNEIEALALVKKALALRDPRDVDALIRTGSSTAVEVVDFFKSMKTMDGEISDYGWLSSIDKNGLSIEGVLVTFVRQDRPRSRLAMLTPDKSGIWKMDFAAFARSVKPSWEDLLTNKTDAGMVRVYVVKDNYYNGPFLNDKKWVAYALASPDMDEVLVGYCKPGTAQFRAMELMWSNGERSITRATLEIRRVAGADRRQFEIARVLAEDWVLGENPLDEAIK